MDHQGMSDQRTLCPVNSCTGFASCLHCWDRKSTLYIERGEKRTQLILRARRLMATFRGVMFADLHICTVFFKGFGADLPLLKTPGRRVGQCRSLPSAGKHQRNSVTGTGNKWFVSPVFSGGGFLSSQFTLESVGIQVPAGGEQERRVSCLPGMAIVHAGACRVWAGSCTLGSWWIRSSLKMPSQEPALICLIYPWHSYRQLVSMSGKLGLSCLRHDLSSRWKRVKKSGIRAGNCAFREIDISAFSSCGYGLKLFKLYCCCSLTC